MRRIVSKPLNTREWIKWQNDCMQETEKLCLSVAEGNMPKISDIYKRKIIKETYFFSRNPPFFGKCAYCESYIIDFQYGDVDHFRPKLAVTNENDQPIYLRDTEGKIMLDDNGIAQLHPGYYWLTYEWRNLLPTCTSCNRPKIIGDNKIGKHSRFPVIGIHAQSLEEVVNEKPLLINPLSENEDDDPVKHLTIDTFTGLLGDRTERGKMCINIFGLNLRENLRDERRQACTRVRALLAQLILGNQKEAVVKELKLILSGFYSYTIATTATFAEFDKSYHSISNPKGENHE